VCRGQLWPELGRVCGVGGVLGRKQDDRKLAKAINVGLLYGMGAKVLQAYALRSYGVEINSEEATHYRRHNFQT
jgi:DNA polymerase I-like protein with 3'-5' exonuclease and polymerase domains